MTRSTVHLSFTLLQFLKKVLDNHKAPTTIVICSTRNIFIHNLNIAVVQAQTSSDSADKESSQEFLNPPLIFLARAQSVALAFCPSLSSLHAYLSVYQGQAQNYRKSITLGFSDKSTTNPTLALLNPISLFNSDPSQFSAQSVSRFFALAHEAAARSEQDLIIAECYFSNHIEKDESDASYPNHTAETERSGDILMAESEDLGATEQAIGDNFPDRERSRTDINSDPWTQYIPISNSNNKRFGSAQRRWLERSITVRTVAERWCEFQDVAT